MASNENSTTPDQREAVHAYMREMADHIGLSDWGIVIESDPPEPEAWATIAPLHSYKRCSVNVSGDLLGQAPAVIHQGLVHELCHLYHSDLLEALGQMMETMRVDSLAGKAIEDLVRRYVEATVDQMARQLVVHLAEKLPDTEAMRKLAADRLDQLGPMGGAVV